MKDIDGNEHMGYFEPDYFSQEMILDYVDGRLSRVDAALFEQQMQQDETLSLAVEGIRGFYTEEQKDRYDLEALMTHSAVALKATLSQPSKASIPKTVPLTYRKQWFGVMAAACVAILMVFSLSQLFKQASQPKGLVGLEDQKTEVDKKRATSDKPSSEGSSPDIVTPTEKRESIADVYEKGRSSDLEDKLEDAPKAYKKPLSKSTDLNDSDNDNKNTITHAGVNGSKQDTLHAPLFGKVTDPNIAKKRSFRHYPSLTSTTAGVVAHQPQKKKKNKGTLHLWVFTDQSNLEYKQLKQIGQEVQATTGLQLKAQKLNVQQYNASELQQMIRGHQVTPNDVVWVHYLGKENPQNYQAQEQKRGYDNTQSRVSPPPTLHNVNTVLENSKASLKILTVDQGTRVLNINNLLNDRSKMEAVHSSSKKHHSTTTNTGISVVGSRKMQNPAYQKLFLDTKGMVTNVSFKTTPPKNNYQGVYTNQLLLNLQKVQKAKTKKANWNSLLRKAEKDTRKGNRDVKRNLRKGKYRR